jgi:hypothetical protein
MVEPVELSARCSKVVPQRRAGATMMMGGFMRSWA